MSYQVAMLDNTIHSYEFPFEIKSDIETARDYINNLSHDFIFDTNDILMRTVSDLSSIKQHYDNHVNVDFYVTFVLLKDKKFDDIFIKDEAWTKERNKEYLYEAFIKYTIKPEYQVIIKQALQELIDRLTFTLAKIEQEEADKKAAQEKRKNELMNDIMSFTTKAVSIEDEGGKTTNYISTVLFNNGEEYVFVDRNVFDVGRVVNPKYKITAESESAGGLAIREGDKWYWQNFQSDLGWVNVREITGNELQAYRLVVEFGNHTSSTIRM